MRHFGFSIFDGRIHKTSDAGIGGYIILNDWLYGKFALGLYIGKYLLSISQKFGLGFCDFYATGCGG